MTLRSLIVFIVPYGCETITFRNGNEQNLTVFERQVFRNIFRPVHDLLTKKWRTLKNREVDRLYDKLSVVIITKIEDDIPAWAGHMSRMNCDGLSNAVFCDSLEGHRGKECPSTRWNDNIDHDIGLTP